jgi:sugar phosphate isomerase/epimerase
MKLSCLPVSLFPKFISGEMNIKEWAELAVDVGLDAIDLGILMIKARTPVYLSNYKNDIEASDMSVCMITTYPDFSHPDRVERERQLAYLNSDIAVASSLGARYVRVTAGQAYPETKIDEGIEWVIESLKYASETAEKFGVQLVYENHSKPGAWEYTDFSLPTDIFLQIAEGIKDVNIGINFDIANPIVYGDDPITLLNKIIDRVVTIHINDTSTVGTLNSVLLGTGLVPIKDIFKVLKESGFEGWLCIEEASNLDKEGIIKASKYVRKTWNEI